MRSSFTAATGLLLLLNVPAFTNGLPHPPLIAPGTAGGTPTSALSSPFPSPTTAADTTTATGRYAPVIISSKDNDGPSGSSGSEPSQSQSQSQSQSDLELQLAELTALRAQLASLAEEVDTRARRLAATARSPGDAALMDCGGPQCVLRAVRRKAGYAVEVLRVGRDGVDGGDRPGQHRRRRRGEDATDGGADLEYQGGVVEVEGFDLLMHRLLFSIVAVFTVQHVVLGVGLILLCFVVLWCGLLCRDVLSKAAGGGWRWWGARKGSIRLGSEEVPVDGGLEEKEEEYLDEKRGGVGEEERYEDEKAGFDEERYRDEYVPLVDEYVEVFADDEEYGANEERLALGDEIASFRSAVELVESMVAATDERHRGRTSHRAA